MANTEEDLAARIARLTPEQRQAFERLLAQRQARSSESEQNMPGKIGDKARDKANVLGVDTTQGGSSDLDPKNVDPKNVDPNEVEHESNRQSLQESSTIPENRILPRTQPTSEFPLSFAQQGLWYMDQLVPDSAFYNLPIVLRLKGSLDLTTVTSTYNELVRRHEIFRTTFARREDGPVQIVHEPVSIVPELIDLQSLSDLELQAQLLSTIGCLINVPFCLETGPLFRCTLIQTRSDEHVLVIVFHHTVYDGWSNELFMRELIVLYRAFASGQPSPLPEMTLQYGDYAVWQRKSLTPEVIAKHLDYWRTRLAGAPALLELPTDRPRPTIQSHCGAIQHLELSPELTRSLKAVGRRSGATLFMTLVAAFNVLLSRYSAQTDIVIGSPIAGRSHADLAELIGVFVNMLVLRTDLSGDPSFAELLKRVRRVTWEAFAHQELPFEKLVEELAPQRSLSHGPIFQVVIVLMNIPPVAPDAESSEAESVRIEPMEGEGITSKYDMTLTFLESDSGLTADIEYNTDLFNASTIERLIGHFQTLIAGIVRSPDQPISTLPLLTSAERQQLLLDWNHTRADYPHDICLHQLFEAQVARTPDATALVFEQEVLTYRELNVRANQIAHYLQRLGIGPDVLVGVCVERSVEMVVALLGILKAGGGYVPLDPAYPTDRIRFVLDETEIPVLLTQTNLLPGLPTSEAKVVCLDTVRETLENEGHDNPVSNSTTTDLAYVIYTSGSTGKPKGVCIEQHSVNNILAYMQHELGITSSDRLVAITTLSFDIAGLELFLPLVSGACIVLASQSVAHDGGLLTRLLHTSGATILQATPATWRILDWSVGLPSGLKALCGGEALPEDLATRLLDEGCELWNVYGPTETTIWSTVSKVERGRVTIGRPLWNTQVYVLDGNRQLTPVGVPGELLIGGDGLARGYFKRPDLTSERFVTVKLEDGSERRLYRTGDLVRWSVDGNLEYLSRLDHQVKIRGFRIELGEIETVLGAHPNVAATVVLAYEFAPGDVRLVAYVEARESKEGLESELKTLAREKLPAYMVPSPIMLLETWPLTPNGKLDRKALPPPGREAGSAVEIVAPCTPTEEALVEIWRTLLGIEAIGIHDDFFSVGGHSLLAVTMMAQVEQRFQQKVALRQFVFNPTIAHLASQIEALQAPVQAGTEVEALTSGVIEHKAVQTGAGMRVPVLSLEQNQALEKLYNELGQPEVLAELEAWHSPEQLTARLARMTKGVPQLQSRLDRFIRQLPLSVVFPLLRQLVRLPWGQNRYWYVLAKLARDFHGVLDTQVDVATMVENSLFNNLAVCYGLHLRKRSGNDPFTPLLVGEKLLEQASSEGRGVIVVSNHSIAHLGNLPGTASGFKIGTNIAGIEINTRSRGLPLDVCTPILFTRYLEMAVETLARGEAVSIFPDGFYGSGIPREIRFHGRIFHFYTGFADLALLTGATVIPIMAEMTPGVRPTFRVMPPLDFGAETMPRAERVDRLCRQYEQLLYENWRTVPWGLPWESMRHHLHRPLPD